MTGHWSRAWTYNPGVFALAGLSAVALLRWFYGRATGHWIHVAIARRWVTAAILGGVLVLEVHQQLHATLLMQR